MADQPPAAPSEEPAPLPSAEAFPRRWHELDSFVEVRVEEHETRRKRRKRRRVFRVLAGLLALTGAFVGLLSWLRPVPAPFFVPLWITEYESRLLPVNAQADPDRQALRGGGYFTRVDENAFASQERHLLTQDLAALRGRRDLTSVVVYLSAFASGDDEGGVHLYPADVRPDDLLTRLSLPLVLDDLLKCPARNKLLILDVMRPLARSRLGVLEDDAAARVIKKVQEEMQKLPGRDRARQGLVLCAASAGQVSLASEDLGRSVFGYYVEEGLRGWADGYNPRREYDSRVSVRELAEYVRLHVDRWAALNNNTRQTPVLLGDAADFQLLALDHGRPRPHPPVPELPAYPAWLQAAWRQRDQWRDEHRFRADPRLLRRLEADLLRAETEWRGGVAATRVQADLRDRLDRYRDQLEQVKAQLPQPPPRSLALAAQGLTPDPSVGAALRDLLKAIAQQALELKPDEAQKAKEKLVQGFLAKAKAKSHFDLAWAVFDVLGNDLNPDADRVVLLDQLLGSQQPQPQYVETLFLHRLAGLAAQLGPAAWPLATVRLAVDVVRKGEQAAVEPGPFPWVRGLLQAAAQRRYDGEVLLFARGYAPLPAAEELLKSAGDQYDAVLNHEDVILRALRGRDEAFLFLPAYVPCLELNGSYEKSWRAAAEAAQDLEAALALPPDHADLSADDLRRQVELLRQRTEVLRNRVEDLRWPFEADHLAALIDQGRQPEATPAVAEAIQAVLLTPFLKADDRQALWKAGRELNRRFLDKTFALDAAEDGQRQKTTDLLDYAVERDRFERRQREVGELRARAAVELFRLGGLRPKAVADLQAALTRVTAQQDPVERSAGLRSLGAAIRRAWAEELPAQIVQEKSLPAQDRLGRILSPFDLLPVLDDPPTNPTVRLYAGQGRALLAWLVNVYRYQSRDLDGQPFFAEAALEYQRLTEAPPDTTLQFSGGAELPALTAASPSATCTVQLTLVTAADTAPDVRLGVVTADDEWLEVLPDVRGLKTLRAPGVPIRNCAVPLTVSLKPESELSRLPRPRGFLVQVAVDGRTFHARVGVPALPPPAAERLEVTLSADPALGTPSLTNLRLRPIAARQPFYVHVRNTTAKERDVVVQLRTKDAALPGATKPLKVGAKQTALVAFTPPAAPAPPPTPSAAPGSAAPPASALPALAEFQGPLFIRLEDPAKPGEALDEKRIDVGIASPREYVGVTSIQFIPPGPSNNWKNRLEVRLRALAPLAGPPCLVQLVLPPNRIPGFVAAKDGNFRGVLPPNGEDLLLYASNIQLAEGTPEDGFFYLTVDGQERAFIFQTTFARQGGPTTPREDGRPAIRLRAEGVSQSVARYQVVLEVDNPPPGSTLELTLSQLERQFFATDLVVRRPQARDRHLGFSPFGPDGALLFEASIRDWAVPLDVSGIRGSREVRAQLLDASGEQVGLATLDVTFDDSPPTFVRFVNPPAQAQRDSPLTLQAAGADNESGIAKVFFFLGAPQDDKVPPTAVPVAAAPVDDAKTTWSAPLNFPPTQRGPTSVSVQFVNGVGLSTFATTTIDVLDGTPKKTGPGKIKGVVLEADRPQAGLEVSLVPADAEKAKQKDKSKVTQTKADGSFEFDNVEPGGYKLTASKATSDRTGVQDVVVNADATTEVKVLLFR